LRPKDPLYIVDVTPVLGVHVGPNGLGVAAVCVTDSDSTPSFAGSGID
jgi:fatty acid-binding protein DegV